MPKGMDFLMLIDPRRGKKTFPEPCQLESYVSSAMGNSVRDGLKGLVKGKGGMGVKHHGRVTIIPIF